MEKYYDTTYIAITAAVIVLICIYTPLFSFLLKKRRAKSFDVNFGLLVSFIGSIIFTLHWYTAIEYSGPIGYGIGMMISPLVILYAALILFLLGWSIWGIFVKLKKAPAGKTAMPMTTLSTRIITALICCFVILAYLRPSIRRITFVKAVPEMNFTNSVEMAMVRISKGYWVAAYEVTQTQFENVMGYNPSANKGSSLPVECLTIDEALEFCNKLTSLEEQKGMLPEGFSYTLPTYKQWLQYVADAGLEGSVTPVGYHDGETLDSPLPVGSGEVNKLGIYDLRGNVCEWSIEPFQGFKTRPTVLGASWMTQGKEHLSIYNKSGYTNRGDKSCHVGFRCVLVRKE